MSSNVRIDDGRATKLGKHPGEAEQTMPIVAVFSGGVFMALAFFGPYEISGFMLSAGFALTALGLLYTLMFPVVRSRRKVP